MAQKKKYKLAEIIIYFTFAALALWGLVYIVLGILASNLPIPDASNPLRDGDSVIRSHFGIGFFGWGLILFGVFGVALALAFVYFAKDIDKEYEKSQRRAARLNREPKTKEVIDAKVK